MQKSKTYTVWVNATTTQSLHRASGCVCECVQLCSEESLYVLQGHTAFTTYRVQRSYGCGWEGGLGQSPVPACAVACLESLAVIPLE